MAQELINIGQTANDGSGDPLRAAFTKINNNFTQLFSTGYSTYTAVTPDNSVNQVILQFPANLIKQGTFQINSKNPSTNDSQNITINVAKSNDGNSIQWSGHNTIFINNPLTQYNVALDQISGNFQLMVSPLANVSIDHLIVAQVVAEPTTYSLQSTPVAIQQSSNNTVIPQSITLKQPT